MSKADAGIPRLSQDERNDGLPGAWIVLEPLLVVPAEDSGHRLAELLGDLALTLLDGGGYR